MADIWSCGVILYQMLCGLRPFRAKNARTLFSLIRTGDYVETGLSVDAAAIIRKLLSPATERLTLDKIGEQPWFSGVKSILHPAKTLMPRASRIRNAIENISSVPRPARNQTRS